MTQLYNILNIHTYILINTFILINLKVFTQIWLGISGYVSRFDSVYMFCIIAFVYLYHIIYGKVKETVIIFL
jgi:hypothetical protein